MYLNKAYIIGNLTRDPELKSLPTGNKVCSFSIATNRVWTDSNKKKQESAEYHNIVVFGRQAETIAQWVRKGDQLLIEGRIQTRSWDDKTTSEKKYRTEIICENFQFGRKSKENDGVRGDSHPDDDGSVADDEVSDFNVADIPF